MESISLTADELAALDRLEDEQARGETVKWDEPKTIRGVAARNIETVQSRDKEGTPKTSRVLTLRTQDGLKAIFDGPVRLNWFVFGDPPPSSAATRPPRKGDLVIVDYRGEKTAPETGRTFKDFHVTSSSASTVDAETAALIGGDPGPEREPNDPGIDEPEPASDDIPF
jgi:hypothetical protein